MPPIDRSTANHHAQHLLTQRRFLPYFLTQFFGAFNDNIFKNVLLLLAAFSGAQALPFPSDLFINLAAGLFILPFFLFSASAGVLADHYDTASFIRRIKLIEILIMLLGTIGFITQNYSFLLCVLFLMGTQSAFFGPVKYSYLPKRLHNDELISGNAFVEMGTFIAILLGTLSAGLIAAYQDAAIIASATVLLFAILGYLSSRAIPIDKQPQTKQHRFQWKPIQHLKQTISIAHADRIIFLSIMAISWFWFLGAVYLTQFPNFTKLHLLGNENAVSLLLALFSIGIACGSWLCDKLSQRHIELGIVPIGALGISLFGYTLVCCIPEQATAFTHFIDFLSHKALWGVFISLFLMGISGGLFIVPLYALMQQRAKENEKARVIAALNIYNALFMVISAIVSIICLNILNFSIPQLFLFLSTLSLILTLVLFWTMPLVVVRFLVWLLSHTMYRLSYKNLNHIPKEGGTLLVCNHVSFMDGLLLSAASPRLIRFVMEEDYANYPPIRALLKRANVIPICSDKRRSIQRAFNDIADALNKGHLVCIFPEGRLTTDGEMQPFMRGVELILRRTPVPVVPIALKGMWGSYFSRVKGSPCKGLPQRFRAPVEIEIGEAVSAATPLEELAEIINQLRGDWK